MAGGELPTFRNPPVVERVFGVQFDPLAKLSSAVLGSFWRTIQPGWPHVEDAAAIPFQFEEFEGEALWQPA